MAAEPQRDWPSEPRARIVAMVHDLRTPLAIVQGFAELLARRGESLTPEERTEYVSRILDASGEIRDILDAERSDRHG